jgi:hypothetical protein
MLRTLLKESLKAEPDIAPVAVTVLEAATVVNEPAAAAVPPIAGGDAKYALIPAPETAPVRVVAPVKVEAPETVRVPAVRVAI